MKNIRRRVSPTEKSTLAKRIKLRVIQNISLVVFLESLNFISQGACKFLWVVLCLKRAIRFNLWLIFFEAALLSQAYHAQLVHLLSSD